LLRFGYLNPTAFALTVTDRINRDADFASDHSANPE
jgi:hypothetical protein